MRSLEAKNLLLINGLALPSKILDGFLSKSATDSNIYLSLPLGVMTLAGWCRREFPNFNIQILDAMMELHKLMVNKDFPSIDSEDFINDLLDQIDFVPDFIGFSILCSVGHKICLDMINLCRRKWPESKIIVGGVHVTTFTYKIIIDPNIDYAIRGPGDVAFLDLLQCLIENKSPESSDGVVTDINNISSMPVPSMI